MRTFRGSDIMNSSKTVLVRMLECLATVEVDSSCPVQDGKCYPQGHPLPAKGYSQQTQESDNVVIQLLIKHRLAAYGVSASDELGTSLLTNLYEQRYPHLATLALSYKSYQYEYQQPRTQLYDLLPYFNQSLLSYTARHSDAPSNTNLVEE